MRTITILFGLLLLTLATVAGADEGRVYVPGSSVTLHVVERQGESFVVDVTNATDAAASFDRIGLYFVPIGNEDPPQRLGVTEGLAAVQIAPHATTRLTLAAHCLDEHRGGPKEKSVYHLAGRRMPTALTTALAGAAAQNQSPQRAIWRVRAQMPTALIGDVPSDLTERKQ
jgi:hypothetical protein